MLPKLHRAGGGGGRAGGGLRPCTLDSTYDEDAEKQSCDSTQVLVLIGGIKEEEEEVGKGQARSEAQHPALFVAPIQ